MSDQVGLRFGLENEPRATCEHGCHGNRLDMFVSKENRKKEMSVSRNERKDTSEALYVIQQNEILNGRVEGNYKPEMRYFSLSMTRTMGCRWTVYVWNKTGS
jgi:hypothetical protein